MNKQAIYCWLIKNRTTARLAFVLRLGCMVANSVLSLGWTRFLLRAMGDGPYGLYVSFLSVASIGGLGDFGITGALAIRTGQATARGDVDSLRRLVSGARGLILLVISALSGLFLLLSPWLPGWLGFQSIPGAGSLSLLFSTGSLALAVVLLAGYVNALNGGYGTVTWPIIPAFLVTQGGQAVQWLLAHAGAPLWGISLGQISVSFCGVLAAWWLLRASHPWLGNLRPVTFDRENWRDLAGSSVWAYLYSLGFAVYVHTDRLLINAGFGVELVLKYLLNAKLCELSITIIGTGAAVCLPKINQWLASPNPADRTKTAAEIQRLNTFQTLLACLAAFTYLAVNDFFISHWLGVAYIAPLSWQIAFALNLAVTASGNAAVQIAGACGKTGLRFTGLTIGFTALLNFGLSFISMKCGSITGIPFATVLAQCVLTLVLSWRLCTHTQMEYRPWIVKGCLYPLLIVGAACALRAWLPPNGWENVSILLAGELVLLAILAPLIGVNAKLLRHEWEILSAMIGRRSGR